MKKWKIALIAGALAWAPALPAAVDAAGLLRPVDAECGDLEIEDHHVRIVINNGFARTEVDQVFHNPHEKDLEAVYSFPVPERAAMSELSLWVDGKELTGEVLPKDKARKIYEEEKKKGKDAALNEKEGYKYFKVSVSPVRAGQDARVRLAYYQPLDIDHGIGRYVYPLEEGGVDDARHMAFFLNDVVTGEATFSLDVELKTSYPVDEVMSPSHPGALIKRGENGNYAVAISSPGPAALRKDFVLHYRLAADRPAGVELIPFKKKGEKEGTFMIAVTPGDDLKAIANGADWTFVLDISGSMDTKLAALAEGVEKALTRMRPNDRFRIVLFDNNVQWLIEPYTAANKKNVKKAIAEVRALRSRGGTNLYAGLEAGLGNLDADRPSGVLLVTDGVANVGVTEHRKFIELARKYDVRLFTFVMGNSANTPLLKDLAEASNGFACSVSNADAIIGKILQAKSKLSHQAMHQVGVKIAGLKAFAVTPSKPLTLYRGDQLVMFGKYRGHGKGKMTLEAKISGKPMKVTVPVKFPEADERNPELERLWALARIEELQQEKRLGGDSREIDGRIRDLGTKYSLVTDETSMVVVTAAQFEEHGVDRANRRRIERERGARTARRSAPAASYSRTYSLKPVSSSKPANLSRRRSGGGWGGGGGGTVGPLFGLLAALAGGANGRRRKRREKDQ